MTRPNGDEEPRERPVTRRTVLGAMAATVGGLAVGESSALPLAPGFSVVQDGVCVPVTPLSGDQSVEQLYDLRIPAEFGGDNGATGTEGALFESIGTRALQRPDTTISFLYDGPNGLSLVTVHGDGLEGTGGSVTWTVEGVPSGADWVVRDDYYTDPDSMEPVNANFDKWDIGGTTHTIDWTYGDTNTDGGALRPLGSSFELRIDPAYNEAAELFGEFYEGRITDWEFLSGNIDAPDRISLALDQPVTVTGSPCGPTELAVDVKPGSDPNSINPRSRGVTPVEVEMPGGYDVSMVDEDTLRFGPPRAVDAGDGASPLGVDRESNSLLVRFPTADTGFEQGDDVGKIVARTGRGAPLFGTDSVRIVPPRRGRRTRRAPEDGGDHGVDGGYGYREEPRDRGNERQDEEDDESDDESDDGEESGTDDGTDEESAPDDGGSDDGSTDGDGSTDEGPGTDESGDGGSGGDGGSESGSGSDGSDSDGGSGGDSGGSDSDGGSGDESGSDGSSGDGGSGDDDGSGGDSGGSDSDGGSGDDSSGSDSDGGSGDDGSGDDGSGSTDDGTSDDDDTGGGVGRGVGRGGGGGGGGGRTNRGSGRDGEGNAGG